MRPADHSFRGVLPGVCVCVYVCACVCAKLCVIYKPQKRRLRPELESGATEKIVTVCNDSGSQGL